MATFPKGFPFEVFIGPRYTPRIQETQHGKWDWANDIFIIRGTALLPYTGQRTLTSSITASLQTTGLAVSDGLAGYPNSPAGNNWPAQAGVWVGPNGTGQGWEYIDYHSAGAQMRRNNQRFYNNLHTAGAPVYFWYPLTMNDGKLSVSLEQTDNMTVRSWTARVSGVKAPTQILKPDHLICVTADLATGGLTAGNFPRFLWGVVDRVTMSQDPNHYGTWEIQIKSMASMFQASTIPGLRVGPMDVALESEASASSTLGAAWKLSLPQQVQIEAGYIPEIDFIEVQEDAGPSHAVDGNRNTLWVSDGWLGNAAETTNTANLSGWASLFVYPPPESVFGSRYMEIINFPNLRNCWIWYYYKYTYPGGTRAHWVQGSEPNMFSQQGVDENTFQGREDRVVLAENANIFRQIFPAANPKILIDAQTFTGAEDTEAVRRLWWEGGAIWLRDSLFDHFFFHWGDVTYTELNTAWKPVSDGGLGQGNPDYDLPSSLFYLNTANLRPGQVFRRELFNPTFVMVYDYTHFPGYELDSDIGGDNPEWFKVTLPEMTHVLRDNITAATTTIYLVDGQGNPNVEGISKGTGGGSIYINDDIVSFASKNYAAGSLTGCTVSKAHKAGTRIYVCYHTPWWGRANVTTKLTGDYIYPFKDKLFEIATAAFPIRTMRWGRGKYSNGADRTPYMGNYVMRFSMYPDARHPPEDSHESDYLSQILIDASSHVPSLSGPNVSINTDDAVFSIFQASEGFRPRTVIFEMRSMNETGTGIVLLERPRLNYFEAEVDRDFFNPETWLALPVGGMHNYLFCYYILFASGAYLDMLIPENPDNDPSSLRASGMTDRDSAWRIAADAAEYGCTEIDVTLSGRTYLRPSRYLLNSTHSPQHTFTDTDIARVEIANVRPAEIGQVILAWEHPIDGLSGNAVYPASAPQGTEVFEIGPLLLPSQAVADIVAANIYQTRRFAYNVFIELNRFVDNVAVGDIVQLTYNFDRVAVDYVDRILMVESIEHEFSGLTATTVLGCREIEREVS